jgi:hypothetical protein
MATNMVVYLTDVLGVSNANATAQVHRRLGGMQQTPADSAPLIAAADGWLALQPASTVTRP